MDDTTIKEKLIRLKFTNKEIDFLAQLAEKEKLTFIEVIIDLRSNFIGGFISRFIILIFCILSLFMGYNIGGVIFTFILSFILIEIFAPFKPGAKISLKFNKIIG